MLNILEEVEVRNIRVVLSWFREGEAGRRGIGGVSNERRRGNNSILQSNLLTTDKVVQVQDKGRVLLVQSFQLERCKHGIQVGELKVLLDGAIIVAEQKAEDGQDVVELAHEHRDGGEVVVEVAGGGGSQVMGNWTM